MLPADRFPGLLELPLGGSLYELLDEHFGTRPGEAVERIEVVAASQDEAPSRIATAATKPQPDLSGRTRFGDASFYAKEFAGREMADGSKMDPHGDNAASKTLPLGTRARVTNIDSGQSAVVTIQDRGPYVKGRIVDLSPSTAQKIGITQDNGVAKVRVTPISVPLPDGSTKLGTETPDSKPRVSESTLLPP